MSGSFSRYSPSRVVDSLAVVTLRSGGVGFDRDGLGNLPHLERKRQALIAAGVHLDLVERGAAEAGKLRTQLVDADRHRQKARETIGVGGLRLRRALFDVAQDHRRAGQHAALAVRDDRVDGAGGDCLGEGSARGQQQGATRVPRHTTRHRRTVATA